MPTLMNSRTPDSFEQRLTEYRRLNRNARPYDIAKALQVSELEILTRSTEGFQVTRLRADWPQLFAAYGTWGRCMALTRNDAVVSEVKGVYGEAKFHGPMGIVHADAIDLRMFSSSWAFVYAVEQKKETGLLRSVQIFDKAGKAVHKTYPENISPEAWQAFIEGQHETRPFQASELQVAGPAKARSMPLEFDRDSFRQDWSQLQDTHDFFGLLKKHSVDRVQALELIGDEYADEVNPSSLAELLIRARKTKLPIMIFVGNSGMLQIRSGTVLDTRELGAWFNVLDPDFNLHANTQKLARAFIVRKPTKSGLIWSLELFDEQNELAVSFFGYRKDDVTPVAPEWQALMEELKQLDAKAQVKA